MFHVEQSVKYKSVVCEEYYKESPLNLIEIE